MALAIAGKIANDWVKFEDTALISALVSLISATNFNIASWKLLFLNSVHFVVYLIRFELSLPLDIKLYS